MSDFMKKQWEDWNRDVEKIERNLQKVDEKLQAEYENRSRKLKEEMKEFLDPSVLEKRYNDLKSVESSMKKLACNSSSIQLQLMKPLNPGRFLHVQPKNQKAVSEFCPIAYDTIMNTPRAIGGLKILASGGSITEKMNEDTYKMMEENRRMANRLHQMRKERTELDKALLRY